MVSDQTERIICRTIGCSSPFAWIFKWPHGLVCYHLSMPDDIRAEYLMRRAKEYDAAALRHPWIAGPLWTHAIKLRERANRLFRKHFQLIEDDDDT